MKFYEVKKIRTKKFWTKNFRTKKLFYSLLILRSLPIYPASLVPIGRHLGVNLKVVLNNNKKNKKNKNKKNKDADLSKTCGCATVKMIKLTIVGL